MKNVLKLLFIGTLSFVLGNCSDEKTNTIVATDANNPPVISELSAEPNFSIGKSLIHFTCLAYDHDNDVLSYEWKTESGDIIGNTVSFTWKAPNIIHHYDIVCTVEDGNGGVAKDTLKLYITDVGPNEAPTFTSVIIQNSNLDIGDTTSVVYNATDYDNNFSRFDIFLNGEGELYSQYHSNHALFKSTNEGDITIRIAAFDTQAEYSISDAIINVNSNSISNIINIPEEYPGISVSFPDTIKINEDAVLEITSADTNQTSITYSLSCEIVDSFRKITVSHIIGVQNKFIIKSEDSGEFLIRIYADSNEGGYFVQKVINSYCVQ